jgi:predicted nucleotidyltransferase
LSEAASGFARALAALTDARVDFVIVGVGGINFYARTPAQSFATLDLDALIAPRVDNLELALSTLSRLGYEFEAGGEPFVDLDDTVVLRRILQAGANLSAHHRGAGQIDLMTSISGFDYPELVADATAFEVAGVTVRVGRLTKLLRSKEASGRSKDVEFLRIYGATLGEEDR